MKQTIKNLTISFLAASLMVSISVSAKNQDNAQIVKLNNDVRTADKVLQKRRIKIAHIDKHDYNPKEIERANEDAERAKELAKEKAESEIQREGIKVDNKEERAEFETESAEAQTELEAEELDELYNERDEALSEQKIKGDKNDAQNTNKDKKPWWKFWGD